MEREACERVVASPDVGTVGAVGAVGAGGSSGASGIGAAAKAAAIAGDARGRGVGDPAREAALEGGRELDDARTGGRGIVSGALFLGRETSVVPSGSVRLGTVGVSVW